MNKKALHILEYEKIIDMLVREADSDPGKDKCRHKRKNGKQTGGARKVHRPDHR